MTIPKYDEIIPYALKELGKPDIGTINWKALESPLAKEFGLTEIELAAEYESGKGRIFVDRIAWALSYLVIAKLVERPKRGFCQITQEGRMFLDKSDADIRTFVKQKFAERDARKKEKKLNQDAKEITSPSDSDVTPNEALNQAAQNIRESVCEEILDTILSKTPYEFEKLVVKLLEKMGYGGLLENAGQVTQQSNDGGIDGIIKEDVLGLGKIHIQAKRYKRDISISREDVQKFVGALAGAQSTKGIFITTSGYSKPARDYVESLTGTTSIVLIDGSNLAEYIYDYGLGMQTEQSIVIKGLDNEFWEKMQDEI
ncbi:MAG: restriction endonuclease [Gammaproteobacteria bacterium]|nr:restriction endonuclease [Gammaproteobacteria bacterium]